MMDEERLSLIRLALGKASLAFMTQPEGAAVVMPTRELLEVADDIWMLWTAEVRELQAKTDEVPR